MLNDPGFRFHQFHRFLFWVRAARFLISSSFQLLGRFPALLLLGQMPVEIPPARLDAGLASGSWVGSESNI